jgi:hypothetical protein
MAGDEDVDAAPRPYERTSSATHSTRWVIGKKPIITSVNAILCGQLRSGGETCLCPQITSASDVSGQIQ